ncbi:SWF or SNF family helicase [Streptomyces sp. DH37]|uniref:SWIM zinc finger family protein n=1 Tax=Streptomyces sp. DH37 TaxID=3040122 RepID=UPI0024431A37|nr:SWF or SNF family helicase [Streptomyces sp. DH37]MDG9700982.1 SWF or SNF family helicase [Streptomyces sp. DH37]
MNESDETGERTFGALPPARGRGFARTWWGQAWIRALEDDALDSEQLRRGRGYARAGAVGAVSVRPGRVTAVVRDRDGTRRRCDVLVRELDGAGWDRLLDVVAGEAGHIAALLDRDLPPRLAEDADAAGVALLPGIGELEPECDCGEWHHCPHTAALCYQLARLLDRDPLLLLLVRGRDERALLEEAQLRSAARAERAARAAGPGAAGARTPEGVPAEEAYALGAILPPLPEAPPAVDVPGGPVSLRGGTPPAPGVDVAALEFLAASTAAAARRLLAEALAPGHAGTPVPAPLAHGQDAVRLAASRPGPDVAARLAGGCGRTPREMAAAVRAWETGGPAALAVLEEEWEPCPETSARARELIAGAWAECREDGGEDGGEGEPPRLRVTGNRWTVAGAGVQLRLGRDGRWWPYRRERGRWWPAGPAGRDPAAALAGLRQARPSITG